MYRLSRVRRSSYIVSSDVPIVSAAVVRVASRVYVFAAPVRPRGRCGAQWLYLECMARCGAQWLHANPCRKDDLPRGLRSMRTLSSLKLSTGPHTFGEAGEEVLSGPVCARCP